MPFKNQIGALDEREPGPRYLLLQKLLREAIESRSLVPGAALPSERELCEVYSLSRVTIRKAIDGLVGDGLLDRRKGAGTFVTSGARVDKTARVEKSFSTLSSFSEDMMARGRSPSSRWLDRREGMVTPEEALSLGVSPGTRVYRFQRMRSADGESMALEHSIVPQWALAAAGQIGQSLYSALERSGHRPVRALQRVRAISFSAEQAELLGIPEGAPCLFIERRAFLRDGRVVEITHSYYRGDAYDLVAELSDM